MGDAFEIEAEGGPLDARLDGADGDAAPVLFAHGAGQPLDSPFMEAVAAALARRGHPVLRFDYPYMARAQREGRRFPPDRMPVLEAAQRAALAALRERFPDRPPVLAGKSMGARVSTRLAAQGVPCLGVACLGYPLHPARRPETLRVDHFPALAAPVLFVQGTRDPHCDLDLLREHLAAVAGPTTLHVVDGGDHSLAPPKRHGPPDLDGVAGVVSDWAAGLAAGPEAGRGKAQSSLAPHARADRSTRRAALPPGTGDALPTDLGLRMERQPDDTTCGPTCLRALYQYWGDDVPLAELLREVPTLPDGGTLAVLLGTDALRRGYEAHLVTWDLEVLDPTWFESPERLVEGLVQQERHRRSERVRQACRAYRRFVEAGGSLELRDLTFDALRNPLTRGEPILTGLSATYLYRTARERPDDDEPDAVRGRPVGHFVVLSGYDPRTSEVLVTDPLYPNALSDNHTYGVPIERLLGAIYLGALTHDANLLHLRPR